MSDIYTEIGKAIHYMVSGYKVSIGENPYDRLWEQQDAHYHEFLIGAAKYIDSHTKVTPEEIHDYWISWAQKYNPNHLSLISYKDLSRTEKIKDKLVIEIAKSILDYDDYK